MSEIESRITAYLSGGGLFNPELANHEAVRDLIIDCRSELSRLTAALAEARGLLEAFYRADIDMHKYDRTAKWLERNP